jgi:hypothetical protein
VLDKTAATFDDDLLFCLNLLLESTGVSDVHAANASREDYIGTVLLDWEVFPPGTAAEVTRKIMQGRRMSSEKAGVVAQRVRLFGQLPVEGYVRGSGSFGSYVGAKYADDLVVFENMNYGNALYVLYGGWEDVSRRSRLDLLRGTNENFDRIVHGPGLEDNFLELIRTELRKRSRAGR